MKDKQTSIVEPTIPWSEVLKLYIERQVSKNHSALTIEKYEQIISDYFAFSENTASKYFLRQFKDHLRLQENRNITVNKNITILKTFFKWALKNEYINQDPSRSIDLLKREERLSIVIREAQIDTLYQELEKDQSVLVQDLIMFDVFYGTGIRTDELVNIKFEDLDTATSTIKITNGKGNKQRIVSYPGTINKNLKSYMVGIKLQFPVNEYLFPNHAGKKMGRGNVYKRISNMLSRLVDEKKGAHTLRHSFATVMIERGAPLVGIQKQLGHSSLATTELYTHNAISRLKAVHEQAHPKA